MVWLMNFKKTRVMNWVIASIIVVSSLIMMLKAPTVQGFLLLSLLLLPFVAMPILTAISLANEPFSFFGIYLEITDTRRKLLRKIAWVFNWVVFVFSFMGVVMCVVSQQYFAIITMLFYLIPTMLNLKALKSLRKNVVL